MHLIFDSHDSQVSRLLRLLGHHRLPRILRHRWISENLEASSWKWEPLGLQLFPISQASRRDLLKHFRILFQRVGSVLKLPDSLLRFLSTFIACLTCLLRGCGGRERESRLLCHGNRVDVTTRAHGPELRFEHRMYEGGRRKSCTVAEQHVCACAVAVSHCFTPSCGGLSHVHVWVSRWPFGLPSVARRPRVRARCRPGEGSLRAAVAAAVEDGAARRMVAPIAAAVAAALSRGERRPHVGAPAKKYPCY